MQLLLIDSAENPECEENILPSSLMVLVLNKEVRREGESKISFCYPRDLRASPQTYGERSGVI